MIQFYVGDNTELARKTARGAFELARSANNAGNAVYFDDVLFNFQEAVESLTGESLFGGENILYFDGILDHPDGEAFYRTILKETAHSVFVREKDPTKDLVGFFGRLGTVVEFKLPKKFERIQNNFAIADALGQRNKKIAWIEYEKTRKLGVSVEEVHGMIFWAIKSMCIAGATTQTEAQKTGMKEFTYKNYHKFAEKYSSGELEHKLQDLKEMYHLGHRGEIDFEHAMERFILSA